MALQNMLNTETKLWTPAWFQAPIGSNPPVQVPAPPIRAGDSIVFANQNPGSINVTDNHDGTCTVAGIPGQIGTPAVNATYRNADGATVTIQLGLNVTNGTDVVSGGLGTFV